MNGSEGTLHGTTAATEDQFLDLPECFRPVAKRYGREMFALVMNAGVARQATNVLAQGLQGQPAGLAAVKTLAETFNALSNAYVKDQKWTEEELSACDRDTQLAFAGKLIVPETRIILAS